jgi:hypothetical protein
MNSDEVMKWLGLELQNLILKTVPRDRFEPSRDPVGKTINILSEMPQKDRARILDLLVTSNQSKKIGDFRWPFDIRDDNDWIDAIIATIEGDLED